MDSANRLERITAYSHQDAGCCGVSTDVLVVSTISGLAIGIFLFLEMVLSECNENLSFSISVIVGGGVGVAVGCFLNFILNQPSEEAIEMEKKLQRFADKVNEETAQLQHTLNESLQNHRNMIIERIEKAITTYKTQVSQLQEKREEYSAKNEPLKLQIIDSNIAAQRSNLIGTIRILTIFVDKEVKTAILLPYLATYPEIQELLN